MRSKLLLMSCMLGLTPMGISSAYALSLEESVAAAIDYSPDVLGQYARFQSVVRDQDEAQGFYLPQVNLYAAAGYEETRYSSGNKIAPDDRGLTRTEVGVKVSQLIFDGLKTSANIDRLGYEAESERLTLIADAENVALDVVRVYLEYLKSQQILELSKRNVIDHETIYNNILDRKNKGLSSNSDLAQIAARVATAKSTQISAQNNLYDQEAQFMRLVGLPTKELVTPVFDYSLLPPDLDIAINQAVENHPEIQAAILDIKAAREEVRREKGGYYPELKLEAYGNKNENIGGVEGPEEDARVMLTLDYDLFNGGSTNARIESAAWRAEQARSIRLRAERQVREGTTLAWNAYNMLETQKQLLQQNVDAAKAAEDGYVQQFNVGRRSLLDVLDAKVEVFLARKNYVNASYDHTLAAYRMFNAMGILTYALRVEHPEEWQTEKEKQG
ncbi:TolC family outer membrane protein [Photobacterium sp. 2_MG-2023]|uniref:TolC family outer membrane protein n=1 Tax=Photobacterium sp. 2_MG-2023 TaxID=3062663 RepID=UPI0026E437F8|nr:TolC family outer membrane protein [Photobacterium sp. 2_MG-2023]MDO6583412.1 TolC family outer membrane protein [Photobacterium sp. 2_MG-2023]